MTELEKLEHLETEYFYHFRAFFCEELLAATDEIEYFLSEEGYEEFLDRHIEGCDSIELRAIKNTIDYFIDEFSKLDLKQLAKEIEEYYKEKDKDE